MRRILTYFISILCAAIGVFVASFYFAGIATEHKFNDVVRTLSILTKQDIKVMNYQRHWFSSDAVVAITLSPYYLLSWQDKQVEVFVGALAQKSSLRTLTVEAHVVHGPLIYVSGGVKPAQALINAVVVLSAEQRALLQRTFTMQSLPTLAKMQMLVNILGDGTVNINSDQFAYNGTDVKVLWQGLKWYMTFSRALSEVKSHIDFLGGELNAPRLVVKISAFKSISNLQRIAGQLLPVDRVSSLPFFQYQIRDGNGLVINDMRYRSSLRSDDRGDLRLDSYLQVANVGFNGLNYRNIDFIWHANRLNAKVFADLFTETMQMQRTAKLAHIQVVYLFERLLKLLNNDAMLDVDRFAVITPWGKLNVTANALFKKRSSHVSWLISLLANSQISLNVSLEHGLALHVLQEYYKSRGGEESSSFQSQAQSTLDNLLRENKLLPADGYYTFSLNYVDRKLLLNNQPFSWVNEK